MQNAGSSATGYGMADRVRNVYKGKVLKLNVERVKLPNGAMVELEVAHHLSLIHISEPTRPY